MAEHRVHVDFFDSPDFSKRDRYELLANWDLDGGNLLLTVLL